MAFTAAELDNIAAATLDFYFARPEVFQQTIQDKPLLALMERKAKTFPGGKSDISIAVQFARGDGTAAAAIVGYTHDDTVTFYTEANIKRAAFPWREHHIGLTLTHTELKHDGISVSDTATNDGTSGHSQREKTALVNILENKMESFAELHSEEMNALLWGDGTGDPKALAGIQSIIVPNPSTGTVGGFDRSLAANAGWRNRARTAAFGAAVGVTPALAAHGGDAVTSNPANGGALIAEMEKEWRQLRRFGGRPDTILCGSDFLDAYQAEIRANGSYSQTGFKGRQDASMGEGYFKNVHLQYDPTLDDLDLEKRAYIFDSRHIFLEKMDQEWRRLHTPARPNNQFLLHKSMTSTGQMVAKQCNSALVIDIT